jgi:glucose/arabinose dehydrogenase
MVMKIKLLAPEYGGNKTAVGRCADAKNPIMAFPGHLAPNDLLFYTGNLFPEKYKNGAFIAFHGSWNRAPLPQEGYFVAFITFKNGQPSGDMEIFANGFAGVDVITGPNNTRHRPMGLAQGPDGSLYISDSEKGRVWKITYNQEMPAVRNITDQDVADVLSYVRHSWGNKAASISARDVAKVRVQAGPKP